MSISLAYKLFLSLIKANIIYIPKSCLKINLFMTYYTYTIIYTPTFGRKESYVKSVLSFDLGEWSVPKAPCTRGLVPTWDFYR